MLGYIQIKAQYIAIYLKPGFGEKKENEGNGPSFFRHQWSVTHLVSTNWSNMPSSFDINCLSRASHGVFIISFYTINISYFLWLTSFRIPLAQVMLLVNKKATIWEKEKAGKGRRG